MYNTKNDKGGLDMKFSDVLRSLAEDRNLTQKRIAADIGVPTSTIGGYFQGTSEPDLEMVKQLAQYFGCSVDLLMGNKTVQAKSYKEDILIHIFQSMTEEQQDLYLQLGKTIVKFQTKK